MFIRKHIKKNKIIINNNYTIHVKKYKQYRRPYFTKILNVTGLNVLFLMIL